jgi:hypothetical protein
MRADSVALTSAWQTLADNVNQDLANLKASITDYPPAPILAQLAQNAATYGLWLSGQDGGTPLKVVQTMAQHVVAIGVTMFRYAVLVPLSFVGAFIAPGVMMLQLITDTAAYPSTPQTVLQAFIDAPAVYLNTTLNCCSTPLFKLAFGLLNPGPLGYLLSFRPSIATALQIPTPAWLLPSAGATQATTGPASPAAAPQPNPAPAVAQAGRPQSESTAQKTVSSSSSKRPAAARKTADVSAGEATAHGQGQSARAHREKSGN